MKRFVALCAACMAVLALRVGDLSAAPLDPELQQQLMAIYGSYTKAIGAGKVNDALATRSAAARKRLQAAMKKPKDRAELLAFAKFMIFDSVDVQHAKLARNGASATILAIATKTFPLNAKMPPGAPPPGSTARIELTLDFVKEGRAWKYDEQTLGGDPDKIAPCKDTAFEPIEAFDREKDVELGGLIRRVEFKPDHTMIVVRVLDEENCAFLPSRETLQADGFNAARLAPYALVRIEASSHRTDKQKVWVENLSVSSDD